MIIIQVPINKECPNSCKPCKNPTNYEPFNFDYFDKLADFVKKLQEDKVDFRLLITGWDPMEWPKKVEKLLKLYAPTTLNTTGVINKHWLTRFLDNYSEDLQITLTHHKDTEIRKEDLYWLVDFYKGSLTWLKICVNPDCPDPYGEVLEKVGDRSEGDDKQPIIFVATGDKIILDFALDEKKACHTTN